MTFSVFLWFSWFISLFLFFFAPVASFFCVSEIFFVFLSCDNFPMHRVGLGASAPVAGFTFFADTFLGTKVRQYL